MTSPLYMSDLPGQDGFTVTPSNDSNLEGPCRSLYIGSTGGGSLKITTLAGNTITFVGLTAGTLLPVGATKVWSTGTDVASIVAIL